MSGDLPTVSVRGNATPEELAAVIAVVTRTPPVPDPGGYRRWRRTRLTALRTAQPGRGAAPTG